MSQNDDPRDDLPAPAEEFVHDSSDAPADPARRRLLAAGVGLAGLTLGGCNLFESKPTTPKTTADLALDRTLQAKVRHIVVIYAENRSFSNLYGNFPGVQYPLESVPASRYVQLDRDGRTPLATLPAIWGGLVPEAQEVNGKRYAISEKQITGLRNAPFHLVDAQGQPLPNGVITRDLVHRFYQNQMQINARAQQPVRRVGRFGRPRHGPLPQFGRYAAPLGACQPIHALRQLLHVRVRRLVAQPHLPDLGAGAVLRQREQRTGGEARIGRGRRRSDRHALSSSRRIRRNRRSKGRRSSCATAR